MQNLKVIGAGIYLEKRLTRQYVGYLKNENGNFVFTYDLAYFNSDNALAFGPEFPLTQKQFVSKTLFPSFEDRIPSSENPAYKEYCESMGIDLNEKDPIILLTTIGKKGPSSFIFYPIFEHNFTSSNVLEFRLALNLNTREFSHIFGIAQSTLNAIETNRSEGKEVLKYLEIFYKYPAIALDYLLLNGGILIQEKWIHATQVLKQWMKYPTS